MTDESNYTSTILNIREEFFEISSSCIEILANDIKSYTILKGEGALRKGEKCRGRGGAELCGSSRGDYQLFILSLISHVTLNPLTSQPS